MFGVWHFGVWNFVLGFWHGIWSSELSVLEYCGLGIQVWHSILEFGFRILRILILEFENSGFGFWALDLEFGVWGLEFGFLNFQFCSLRIRV